MTARVVTELGSERLGRCVARGGQRTPAASDAAALNGIATRGTNCTRESPAAARARSPWAAVVVAAVIVALVLAVELWAARHAPAQDGTVVSEVATEVSDTLGDVAASSILIGPTN